MMFNSVFAAVLALAATAVAAPAEAAPTVGSVQFCRGADFVDCGDINFTYGICSTFGGHYHDNSATSLDTKGPTCMFYVDEYCKSTSGFFSATGRVDLSKNKAYEFANDAISSVYCEKP
ncbi:uncharacterized protein L3040_008047 [Drepanopeziza brunnea f. sp. 'multigermtubi']|uniref:Small secreted protein n=1 Tax=Marssonina brunnea f. sp. multigermtubi (strain MB_m1) TaxID=1072389 RepID=K1WJE0_MARBU|nr:uncharacterized protein MBM_04139 [Drepanopeziza brunnea f. sp. 'multigermtubi' MB_m1]EKD17770.1 hypothetical protein MBM_04139 [Drepanopeziza brunnea f. sp. 'multigermtubi' MB_m1]KAJ5035582.1 hypothetical protein L3040_008047 [Drepanopeziza brunnea f. sp. 'multigermtubi']